MGSMYLYHCWQGKSTLLAMTLLLREDLSTTFGLQTGRDDVDETSSSASAESREGMV